MSKYDNIIDVLSRYVEPVNIIYKLRFNIFVNLIAQKVTYMLISTLGARFVGGVFAVGVSTGGAAVAHGGILGDREKNAPPGANSTGADFGGGLHYII